MAVLAPLAYADRSQILTCQDIVENGAGAANRETEDQASISNPVRCARSKRLGGFQYRGTKSGSVSPNGIVNALAQSITAR
jgi:hypothetical protein